MSRRVLATGASLLTVVVALTAILLGWFPFEWLSGHLGMLVAAALTGLTTMLALTLVDAVGRVE